MKNIIYHYLVIYFSYFSRIQLAKYPRATVVGITGSAGKTSTRLALVHILKTHGAVKHSVHANSEIGLPLNILGLHFESRGIIDWFRLLILTPIRALTLKEKFDYYVVEMGIDSPNPPKNMATLLKIVQPQVGIVLNAGLSHAEAFDHLVKDPNQIRRAKKITKLIAKEKMQLVKSLGSSGVAVVNIDQPELVGELKDVVARKLTFGKSVGADLRLIQGFKYRYQGTTYQLQLSDYYPPHFAYTFGAAIAASAGLGIPPSLSIKALESYTAPAGRMKLLPGIRDAIIIDSSYNASPATMSDALHALKQLGGRGKKIAVLGDMRELGAVSKPAHKDLAAWIESSADQAILFGSSTLEYTYPLLQAHKFPVRHFTHMSDLILYLKKSITSKSHILVKGSQNNLFMERAVEGILADQEDILADQEDIKLLCRRGKFWDRLRAKTP